MSRDVLISGNIISFVERSELDHTIFPDGTYLIYEVDWKNLLDGNAGSGLIGVAFIGLDIDKVIIRQSAVCR